MSTETNILEPHSPSGTGAAIESGEPTLVIDNITKPIKSKDTDGVALALGGGAARGWSHIGVLRALDEAQIPMCKVKQKTFTTVI